MSPEEVLPTKCRKQIIAGRNVTGQIAYTVFLYFYVRPPPVHWAPRSNNNGRILAYTYVDENSFVHPLKVFEKQH